jgi:hypothetical protein
MMFKPLVKKVVQVEESLSMANEKIIDIGSRESRE